jgi:hypothetical protein
MIPSHKEEEMDRYRIYNIFLCPVCEFYSRRTPLPFEVPRITGECSFGNEKIEIREIGDSLKNPIDCKFYKRNTKTKGR